MAKKTTLHLRSETKYLERRTPRQSTRLTRDSL